MSIIDLNKHLKETITVARVTGLTRGGDPIRGHVFTCRARIERSDEESAAGASTQATHGAEVITTTPVRLGDMLFFPGDNPANADTGHVVRKVDHVRALDGTLTHYSSVV